MGGTTTSPRVNISLLPAESVSTVAGRRDIIFGQFNASSHTAQADKLVQNVQTYTDEEIYSTFGATTELAQRIIAWIRGNDRHSQLDVLPVDYLSGLASAALGQISISGTATEDGEYIVSLVDERLYTATVSIESGDVANDVRDKMKTAIDALPNRIFTTTAAPGAVNLSSSDRGELANGWGVKIVGIVAGVSISISNFSGGLFNPTIGSSTLDPIDGIRYTGASWPEEWDSELSTIVDEFDSRYNASNTIMDGVVFHGRSNTYANNLSVASAQNSQSLVLMGNNELNEADNKGPAILTPADWAAAYFMGVRAKRLTESAPIASEVTARGALDSIGGSELASLPYANTELKDAQVSSTSLLYSPTEQASLEANGFTTFGIDPTESKIIMSPAVTTYTEDAGGNSDTSFLYLNFVDTGSVCREIFFNTLKSVYAQSRLVNGDLIPGRSMANAESIKAVLLRIYKNLAERALTIAGSDAEGFFTRNTSVAIDLLNRSVTISSKLPIVTQLGVFDYPLQLAFTTTE